jgi:endo-1,4-beta-D-glucanase Y
MVIAAYMADHADFDALFHYTKAHPSRIGKNLTAWKQSLKDGSMHNVSGADSATDGDMDIACRLIDAAVDAGADIVKFQTFSAERLVTKHAQKASYQKANQT